MSKKKDGAVADAADTRDIPSPPGGGSWTFDHVKFEWVPNDVAAEAVEQAQEQ
jgi:hypothetical protein